MKSAAPARYTLPPEQYASIFPHHIVVDVDGKVLQVGGQDRCNYRLSSRHKTCDLHHRTSFRYLESYSLSVAWKFVAEALWQHEFLGEAHPRVVHGEAFCSQGAVVLHGEGLMLFAHLLCSTTQTNHPDEERHWRFEQLSSPNHRPPCVLKPILPPSALAATRTMRLKGRWVATAMKPIGASSDSLLPEGRSMLTPTRQSDEGAFVFMGGLVLQPEVDQQAYDNVGWPTSDLATEFCLLSQQYMVRAGIESRCGLPHSEQCVSTT